MTDRYMLGHTVRHILGLYDTAHLPKSDGQKLLHNVPHRLLKQLAVRSLVRIRLLQGRRPVVDRPVRLRQTEVSALRHSVLTDSGAMGSWLIEHEIIDILEFESQRHGWQGQITSPRSGSHNGIALATELHCIFRRCRGN